MTPTAQSTNISIPASLVWLLERRKWRYKGLYGGRGGVKSWTMARSLLVLAGSAKERILCAREFQQSIKDSVHKLLVEQIDLCELPGFRVTNTEITHEATGSEFIFTGLRHNITKIKSMEGVTIAWVEEAENVSEESWQTLLPTIRVPDSEIWVSFNPRFETDATYKRFVFNQDQPMRVQKVTYLQNPWCPQVLLDEAARDKRRDPDEYRHVWLGECRPTVEGAIYEKELARCAAENRIQRIPYDQAHPVHTAWDLGISDKMAIWMFQHVGQEIRILDYEEDSGYSVVEYIQKLQRRPYIWGDDYLPWDGGKREIGSGQSIEDRLRLLGRKPRVVPMAKVVEGIDAVRTLFPRLVFDSDKCEKGLGALRHYAYEREKDDHGQEKISRNPMHNWASHAADALRTLAMGIRTPKPKAVVRPAANRPSGQWAWT